MDFLCSFAIAPGKVVRFCSFDLGFLDLDFERLLTYFGLVCILSLYAYFLVFFVRQATSLLQILRLLFSALATYVHVVVFLGYSLVPISSLLAALRLFLVDNPSYLWAIPLVCGVLYLGGLCLVVLGQSVLLRVLYYGIRACLWLARLAHSIYDCLPAMEVTLSKTRTLIRDTLAGVEAQVSRLACAPAFFWGIAGSVLKSLARCVSSGLRLLNPLAVEVDAQAALIIALQAIIADQKAALTDDMAALVDKDEVIANMQAVLADKEAAFDDVSVLLRWSNASQEAANASLDVANASIVEKDNAIQEITATLNGAYALSAQREIAIRAKSEAVEELEVSLQGKLETIENMTESIRVLNASLSGARAEAARYKRLSDDLQVTLSEKRAQNDHLRAVLQDVTSSNAYKDDMIEEQAAKMRQMTRRNDEKSCQIADLESTIAEISVKLHDVHLVKEKQETQLEAKIDAIDDLKEKVVALESQVDQSKLKALRVERAHRKEIEDALRSQLELQALVTSLQSVAAHQAQALEQKDRLITTREDEIAVMSASYNAAVETHSIIVKNHAKSASAPTSTKAEAAVDTADLPAPDAAVLAHTVEQNKALAAQLLHMDAEHTEQILKAKTDLEHARTAVLALRGELDGRDSEIFDLKQQLLDARNHSHDASSFHESNSSQSQVLSTNMWECKDIVVPELPASLSWAGAHFSSPRQSMGDSDVPDSFDNLLEAMSSARQTETHAQPEPLRSPSRTPSVAPSPDASSSFDFKQYLASMSCELLHDHISFISQDRDSFWLKDAAANTEVNTDVVVCTEDMPESIPSSSSFDSAFWGQKGMGSCDLLHDKITLGGRDDSFWMRSTDSIPAMLKSSKGQEPERPTLSRSESTSSLDNSFWGRKPECNLLADDISLGGDDDSFWVKSDDESASECGEEFLTPASTSPETFESSPPHEPEVETEESPCEDVTFRAPLKEGTDEPEQPVKTPASPQRGRSSRVKALQNLDQFVDLPTPLAAPFELPTTSGDASSTPISIAKRTERRHPLATASD